jgi:thiosulfate/3-mercaptopyruvate sulfurtransferase
VASPQAWTLVDARGAVRYRGEVEPIDPVAGHIPGAVNLPFEGNVLHGGRFRDPADLAERYRTVASAGRPVVFYCGSGVTACHDLLAFAHAGLGEGHLYAGSWSEWIQDPQRPVARGDAP